MGPPRNRRRRMPRPVCACERSKKHQPYREKRGEIFDEREAALALESGGAQCFERQGGLRDKLHFNSALCSYEHDFSFGSARKPFAGDCNRRKTWPPVPPPAIKSFMARPISLGLRLLRNIQEHACGQEHYEQTRTAVADERQRNSFRRHACRAHSEIDKRLAKNHRGDAKREKAAKTIGRGKRRAQTAPAVNREQSNDDDGADKAEFLADHCIIKSVCASGDKELLVCSP